MQFNRLNNIILFNMSCVKKMYQDLYQHFRGSDGIIVNLISQKESEIECFSRIIDQEKRNFASFTLKQFPLKLEEINAFRYRVSDVVAAMTKKQI